MPGPIPRIINQIWLNGEPPDMLKRLQERMMKFNPGYELRLWKPEHFPALYNAKWYEKIEGYNFKSDIVRYEIMWRHPGLYVDFDVIFWRSLDDIFDAAGLGTMPDNFFVMENDETINNCVWGVGPGSPIAVALVTRLDFSARMYENIGGRTHQTGVPYFTRVVKSFPETAYILPRRTFHSGLNLHCAIKAAKEPDYAAHACHFYNSNAGFLDDVMKAYITGQLSDNDKPVAAPAPPPFYKQSPPPAP